MCEKILLLVRASHTEKYRHTTSTTPRPLYVPRPLFRVHGYQQEVKGHCRN